MEACVERRTFLYALCFSFVRKSSSIGNGPIRNTTTKNNIAYTDFNSPSLLFLSCHTGERREKKSESIHILFSLHLRSLLLYTTQVFLIPASFVLYCVRLHACVHVYYKMSRWLFFLGYHQR
jgi:hypothetical protein